jgi:hypothetical protein
MVGSQDYRRFAQECLQMAKTADSEQVRAALLHMAQVWLGLAEQRERDGGQTDDDPSG